MTCSVCNAVNWLYRLFIELNLHLLGKHLSRCFHSEIHSAMSAHGNSQLEIDIAIDKTEAEYIREKVKIYIVLHPSKTQNGGYWLRSWTADRNRLIKHTWENTRQHTSVSVGWAACARSQIFSDVWELDTKLQCDEYLNTCKQTISDVCTVNSLMYQH